MATVTRGKTFAATETITNDKLHQLVDSAIVTAIVDADISSAAAISDSKLGTITSSGKIGGTSFSYLASIPSGAGYIPYQNLASIPANTLTNLSSLTTLSGVIPVNNLGTGTPSAGNVLKGDGSFGTISSIQDAKSIDIVRVTTALDTGGTYYDVTGATVSVTLAQKGTIYANYISTVQGNGIHVTGRIVYGATPTVISTSKESALLSTGVTQYLSTGGTATSVPAGTYTVKFQVKADQDSYNVLNLGGFLTVIAY